MALIEKTRWAAIGPLLDQLLDIDATARAARLEEIRRDDAAIADELAALLAQQALADREGFLQGSVSHELASLEVDATLEGQVIGGYTLDRPIGQGGMGSVWLAHRSDGRYEGKAAVKFLNLAMLGRGGAERFQREGSFLARLAHPHIARLIDAGVAAGVAAGGQPYLILEYVEGEQIDRWCDAHQLDVEARVRLFLDVLKAVAHAHNNLILHRDLKPSNILVTHDGQVKLLDFGVAKLLNDEAASGQATELTQLAGRAFTPEYAAPEQVLGQDVTTATDVYSLGVLLYLLLGGHHPTSANTKTPIERLQAVIDTEPERLSDAVARHAVTGITGTANIAGKRAVTTQKIALAVRGDLDNIVAKALKKNPVERYATVSAFADDLCHYLNHEPVSARADLISYRIGKFVRRHRLSVGAACVTLLTLVAGITGTAWQAVAASRARDTAVEQAERAGGINRLLSVVLSEVSTTGASFTTAELLSRAEQWAEKLYARDPKLHAEVLMLLGDRIDHSDGERALKWYEEALALAKPLPEPALNAAAACRVAVKLAHTGTDVLRANQLIDTSIAALANFPIGMAARTRCLGSATYAAIQRGDTVAAVKLAEQTRREAEHEPGPPLDRLAGPVAILASAYTNDGRYAAAKQAHEEGIAILRESGLGESVRMATALNNAGVNLLQAGASKDALAAFEQALAIERVAGTSGYSINTNVNYAASLLQIGRTNEAVASLDRSVEEARRQKNPVGLGRSLLVASRAHLHAGDLPRATTLTNEAAALINATLPPRHVGRAALLTQQGRIALAYGDTQKARDLLLESNEMFEMAGPRSSDRALTLAALADVHRLRGEHPEAIRRAEEALALARKAAGDLPFSYRVGVAALAMCEAGIAAGRAESSQSCDLAVAQLAGAVGDDAPMTQQARKLRARSGQGH
jgi:eukaryotic-like serine/threonine-protein kinase